MSPRERTLYQYEQEYEKLLDIYCMEEDRGTSIFELERMDVKLYFKLKSHRIKKKKVETFASPDEAKPNTTIDAVFNFH